MKQLKCLLAVVLFVMALIPVESVLAQKSLPRVPITYPGDTNETIIRRAQLIEGAKKEGKLVWWTTITPKQMLPIIDEFKKVYPFIRVEFWRGEGEAVAAKLDGEFIAGRQTVDTAWGGEPINFPRWTAMGVLEKYTDIIPEIKKWHPKTQGEYWAMVGGNVSTTQYNTKLVPAAEAPKNWEDLLQPKWKGQIGVVSDMKVWYTLALAEGGWGVEKTEDFLRKLREQRPLYTKGVSEGHALLIAGEFKIFAVGYLWHVLRSQREGAPVEWVRNRPVVFTGSSAILMKKAPHPNSARLLLEWLLSPRGLKVVEDATFKGSPYPGMGTIQSNLVAGLPFVDRDQEVIKKAMEMKLDERLLKALGAEE